MAADFDHWNELQDLFHLAEETPEGELDAVLEQACGDAVLRSRVKLLVEAGRRSEPEGALPGVPRPAEKIGPYTIVRHLGAGGVGTVYLVERMVAGAMQRSALKVLSRGAAGPMFKERFAREQHILASLDHPNITRVLDAGVTNEGQSYLVMEYVDGVHLDRYCDERGLGLEERLRIFVRICEAIAYAHRNLIVHLDLKPSNILVTEKGAAVKVLDFGTSKLIQPDSLLTTTVMATPAYASPEQLLHEPVTTVCDVYALGAILFELLSGRRPNRDSSAALLIERSLKEYPPEPMTDAVTAGAAMQRGLTETRLRGQLEGDLATIVAKCLNARPKDRYTSVDALMADVQRYLGGRPILARPQTTTYRISKFVRRNRSMVVLGVAASLALAASLGYGAWRQEQAVRAGERALHMQNFMYSLFKLANTSYMGKPSATVPEFLQLGVRVLPDFIKSPVDLRAGQLGLAESMFDNEDLVHAQPVLDQVIASAKRDNDVGALVEADAFAGAVAYRLGQNARGEALGAESVQLAHKPGVPASARIWAEEFYASAHWNIGVRTDREFKLLDDATRESREPGIPYREKVWCEVNEAEIDSQMGKLKPAEMLANDALAQLKKEPYTQCDQAYTSIVLGDVRSDEDDHAGAVAVYRQAQDGFRQCQGEDSLTLLGAVVSEARELIELNRAGDAAALLEGQMPRMRKAARAPQDLVLALVSLARAEELAGHFDQALQASVEAAKIEDGKLSQQSTLAGYLQLVWAVALEGLGRSKDAYAHAKLADETYTGSIMRTSENKTHAATARALVKQLQDAGDK